MYILGINAYHADSSACLLKDGQLIAAVEEERIRRIKHWAGLPIKAVEFCLDEAGITLDQVDHIAISKDPKARLLDKFLYATKKPKILLSLMDRAKNARVVNDITTDLCSKLGLEKGKGCIPKVHFIEHHRTHNASSFFTAPFEEAALLSIDGMGDFTSTMLAHGRDTHIQVLESVKYPHSLGYFYTAMTQYLGFPEFGDEYKVMGLASYGSPIYYDQLKKLVIKKNKGFFELNHKYFSHFRQQIKMTWDKGRPRVAPIYSRKMTEEFGPPRKKGGELSQYHKDIAASAQKVTESIIYHLCELLYAKTRSENLCLSGGVGQNSVANGKILQNSQFKRLYVPTASHDGGTSMGAALYLHHHIMKKSRVKAQNWAYSGAKFCNEDIKLLLTKRGILFLECEEDELYDHVTDTLTNRGVVGWFQGRTEFGPRALGNRSILVDPSRSDARDLLNMKIKKREVFRPFASSILQEKVGEYFECKEDAFYMEKVFQVKKDKGHLIPAVTHADGSARIQAVNKKMNPRFYGLINRFYEKTHFPLLLNTSFNENEPIVNSPDQALDCFLRTGMDMLVMENIVVSK